MPYILLDGKRSALEVGEVRVGRGHDVGTPLPNREEAGDGDAHTGLTVRVEGVYMLKSR